MRKLLFLALLFPSIAFAAEPTLTIEEGRALYEAGAAAAAAQLAQARAASALTKIQPPKPAPPAEPKKP